MKHITKTFGEFPFGHRQPNHKGHCRWVHGHNWSFDISFVCDDNEVDENGFVLDFGEMKVLKAALEHMFDHTCLISTKDPQLPVFQDLAAKDILDLRIVENGSAEGLGELVYNIALEWLTAEGHYARGVRVAKVVVWEDKKNSTSFPIL
jgi:6-pyruvoyltetrahydropterin/6-carboxytetrahydropterin synthase